MNHSHGRKYSTGVACAAAILLGGASAPVMAQDTDWLGIVYLWGSGIDIDTRNASASVDFNDLIDNLEMRFMGHVEAQGDNIGGFVDVLFVGVGKNETRQNAQLNIDNDTTAMDLAVVWSPGAERMTGFELFGGLRYVNSDSSFVVDPIPPLLPTTQTGRDKSYTDALIGARYIAPLSEHWRPMPPTGLASTTFTAATSTSKWILNRAPAGT